MAAPTVYVICDSNCKFEGMTKEQILAAITQAVERGTVGDCDTGFITTIKTINGLPLKFFVGTQAEYDILSDDARQNLFALITNDTTKEGLLNSIKELSEKVTNIDKKVDGTLKGLNDGTILAKRATLAENATKAIADDKGNKYTEKYLRMNGDTKGVVSAKATNGALILGSTNGTFYHAYIEFTTGTIVDLGVVWWNGTNTVYSPVSTLPINGRKTHRLFCLKIEQIAYMGGVPQGLAEVYVSDSDLFQSTDWGRFDSAYPNSTAVLRIIPMTDTPEPSLMA